MNDERIAVLQAQLDSLGEFSHRGPELKAEIAKLKGQPETATAEPTAERAVRPAASKRKTKA